MRQYQKETPVAALYGTLRGGRSERTATGTKASGITSQVQTYSSAVRVHLTHDDNVTIVAKHPTTGRSVNIFEGNLVDLLAGEGR